MDRYNKHLEDGRAIAEIAASSEAASKVGTLREPRRMAHPLDWTWKDHKGIPREHKLEEFRDGNEENGITGKANLIHDLAPSIRTYLFGKTLGTHASFLTVLRVFWRSIINTQEKHKAIIVNSTKDISDDVATLFFDKLRSAVVSGVLTEGSCYLHWYRFCSLMHRAGCNITLWPEWVRPRSTMVHTDVPPRSVKYLYEAAKRVVSEGRAFHAAGQSILSRFEEGASSLIELTNAHLPGAGRPFGPEWNEHDNIIFTVYRRFRIGLMGNCKWRESPALSGAIAGAVKRLGSVNGVPEHVEWTTPSDLHVLFAPTSLETMAALTLVTAETGWLDTARAIDVSSDDWFREGRRQTLRKRNGRTIEITEVIISGPRIADNDDFSAEAEITAIRPKTQRRHQTRSLMQSEKGFRAFAVIKYMIERTRSLRESVEAELEALRRITAPSPDLLRRIADLDEQARCPWLYYCVNGKILSGFTPTAERSTRTAVFEGLKGRAVDEAIRRGEAPEVVEGIESLKFSDFRDAYAAWIYNRTGNDIFAVQAALNHRGISTTRRYLRQRAQIRDRYAACARVMESGFDEVEANRIVDPTVVRLLADQTGQGVTEEDRAFLAEFRSTCGARCVSPTKPPEEIELASERDNGELCVTQRCGLCRHARFDATSLRGVAVRIAELKALCAVTPSERWLLSVYPAELEALELLVEDKFADHAARVWGWEREHRRRLERGDELVFGVMSVKTASIRIGTSQVAVTNR